jgi:single-stranded-DNA-specific exonuclease
MHRRWLINRTNHEYILYLSRAASVSPVVAQILVNRGVKTPEEITAFLSPSAAGLSDPFNMPGIQAAVERIFRAAKDNERVLVHGDYDADGITATAIVLKTLRTMGMDCHYFIPDRLKHGYGFKAEGVRRAKDLGAGLLITVDCGITSFEAAALAKHELIDIIITDHHEPLLDNGSNGAGMNTDGVAELKSPRFVLPEALVVINPKAGNCNPNIENLSGAGVALKLAHALLMKCDKGSEVLELTDLAAIGTAADVVPLTGENRIIVQAGLKLMESSPRHGIREMKKVSGIDGRELKAGQLSFTLIPRINAAGRISGCGDVVSLLLTESHDEAQELSLWLDGLNGQRQGIEEMVYQEALLKLGSKEPGPVIVLSSEGWHRGVIGIVASRIAETFCRPVFIISIDGDSARGSARSIPAVDIYKAISSCADFLTGFGGHKQAAGIELRTVDISAFEECINRVVGETLDKDNFTPVLQIDADVDFCDITFSLARELKMLEPFGFGNPEPLLGARHLEVLSPRVVGSKHLKMKLRQKSQALEAIGFDMGHFMDSLDFSSNIDAVFTPCINEWEGRRCLQLNLKALRPST